MSQALTHVILSSQQSYILCAAQCSHRSTKCPVCSIASPGRHGWVHKPLSTAHTTGSTC